MGDKTQKFISLTGNRTLVLAELHDKAKSYPLLGYSVLSADGGSVD